MKKALLLTTAIICFAVKSLAVDFNLSGNTTACFLELRNESGTKIEPAKSSGLGTYNVKYEFKGVEVGTYMVVGFLSDTTTVCGKLKFELTQECQDTTISVLSVVTGVSNSGWTMGKDWSVESLTLTTNKAKARWCEYGQSSSVNKVSFIGLKSDTYVITFSPNDSLKALGYANVQGTATMNVASSSISYKCEQYGKYSVVVDENVNLSLGWKTGMATGTSGGTHYVPLNNVEPVVTQLEGGKKKLEFTLCDKYYYMYHASMEGKRSLKGYFCYYADTTGTNKIPLLNLSAADFGTLSPKNMITDPALNSKSNVADIFMNVNEKGFLQMAVGEERDLFAQRTWQIINTTTGNYYIEPDYHYTVVNENGEPDNSVLTFDHSSTTWNPWVKLRAVGEGTAIVLVTYDACKTKIHTSKNGAVVTSDYVYNDQDGEWSALWPENTGVFVVKVGGTPSTVVTGMKNLEGFNVNASSGKPTRTAAENVDAELDVFYYVGNEGYTYSFKPENAKKVEIAYPQIGESMTSYSGFAETGVTKAADGTYSVLLKKGTNIVRLQDEAGNYTYQVLRAKPASYEVTNETHPGETPQAGDKVKIQFSGLYHPCNKLSGIYNMTSTLIYKGVPNYNTFFGGVGQYTFGGNPAAQAISITIPETYDSEANNNQFTADSILIRTIGFGSAYGAHRYLSRETGATPNLNASTGTSYFGALPTILINTKAPAATSIEKIAEDAQFVEIRTVDGRKATRLQHGLNIVKMSDGSVRKIYVK